MRKSLIWIAGGLLALSLAVVLVAWNWWQWALKPYAVGPATQELLTVLPGMNTRQIASELENRHLIRNAWVFSYLARTGQVDAKLKPGEYKLSAALSPQDIINKLLKGPDIEILKVTIPEGFTTEQIITTLVQKGLGTKEAYAKVMAADTFPYSFLKDAPEGPHRLDGFLFPDTYYLAKDMTPHAVIDKMLERFGKEITPDTESQLKAMKFSIRQWVILASIVEKEAVKETDRPLIASVFLNRLAKKMKLESCATIQYILGTPKPKLYDKDLQIPSPYNTYLHAGLPPGPIASPGHASLDAVLHPAQSDYLFFLAKSDGYHVFAKTFEEHLENQRKYQ